MIKLLIGGSPCTYWSIAQKNNRETEPSGLGWELFENYLIAKDKFQPDFFLYENNKSAAKAIKDEIKRRLNVWDGTLLMEDSGSRYIEINSALVSAQNRQRFYVHNCGEVGQPEDRGILLKDILESGDQFGGKDKSYCLVGTYYKGQTANRILEKHQRTMVAEPVRIGTYPGEANNKESKQYRIYDVDGKTYPVYEVRNGLITIKGKEYPIKLADGFYIIRKLTVKECCRLQGMPGWWFLDNEGNKILSDSQAYKGLGNGWQLDTVKYILEHGLKNVPRNEELIVLSLYDGIATGRRMLEELGFTKVKYYAYEIDKYCIKLTSYRYPDIIHCGDAFKIRNKGEIEKII